jgi:sulfur-carrier protein
VVVILRLDADRPLQEDQMPVIVRIPTPLRSITKGSAEVPAKGETVDDVMQDLERQFPGLRERLVDEKGELRRFINLYVNEEDVRFLQGRTTVLKDGDTVSIVPAIAGGR